MPLFIRRFAVCLLILMAATLATSESSVVYAQAPNAANNVAADPVPSASGRKFYLETFVVLLLVSAAVYSVCRSSRRV